MVEDRWIFEAYVDFRAMHRWASSSEPRSAELGPIANGWCQYGQRKSERDRIGQTKIRQHSHNVTISTCEGMRHLTGNVGLN